MKTVRLCEVPRLLDFYQRVVEETNNMAHQVRWVYGLHPAEEMIRGYVMRGMLYDLEAERDVVAAVAVTPFQTEEYHGVSWQAALKDEEVAVVHLLAVNPRYQKRGYAKAIMKEVMSQARREGLKAVSLDALASNTSAHRLYESLGFQRRDIRHWYAPNTGWTDFYLYECLLSNDARRL